MKKIIILYQYGQHSSLVINVCKNMLNEGLLVDALNVSTGKFYSSSGNTSLIIRLFSICMKFPRGKGIIILFFLPLLLKAFSNYHLVDIHYVSTIYDTLIFKLKKRGIKIKVMFWGSDFYRASQQRLSILHKILNDVNIIQLATENFKKDFLKEFPEYENKIEVAHFGLNQLEVLKDILKRRDNYPRKSIYGSKIVVACGYNGSEGQQHVKIIQALSLIDERLKNNIFLVFPMTYGSSQEYQNYIIKKLNESKFAYEILNKRLTLEDLLIFRCSTDIVVNIQITDAFSASLQEHIMAGNVMVLGNWLPYSILQKNDIFTVSTSIQDLSKNLNNVISNYKYYKDLSNSNTAKMYKLSSWNYLRKRWSKIYTSIIY